MESRTSSSSAVTTVKLCGLVIGDELMDGSRADEHTRWIAQRLKALGLVFSHVQLVRDQFGALHHALRQSLEVLDDTSVPGKKIDTLLITSGGLGPTSDDLTLAGLKEFFKWELDFHQDSFDRIQERLGQRNIAVNDGHKKQCYLPKYSVVLPNDRGTAPGAWVEEKKRALTVLMLPGPPVELHHMFDTYALPLIQKKFPLAAVRERVIQVFDTPESSIADAIQQEDDEIQALVQSGVPIRIGYREKRPRVFVKVVWQGSEYDEVGEKLFSRLEKKLQQFPYVQGAEEDLEFPLIEYCRKHQRSVSVAESCTGGMLSARLTNVPGSAEVIRMNYVTYSNEAKTRYLQISPVDLERHGAVSEVVARAMAEGAARETNSHFGVGVTGIAGPGGGTVEKPVGTVFIGVHNAEAKKTEVTCHHFRGSRAQIRHHSVETALWRLWKQLQSH